MKLKDQVESSDLAKELKELGVNQDSLFSWIEYEDKDPRVELTKWAKSRYGGIGEKETELYPAYSVAELGEMLQGCINDEVKGYNEADARAKMLIYFIKTKKIKAENLK